MNERPSAATWRRVIAQAWKGDPRHLLELLLSAATTDGPGNPTSFYDLPNDPGLRQEIIRTLIFGPWRGATTIKELMTKTGWGKGKPKASEFDISAAALKQSSGASEVEMDDLASALDLQPETLQKRIRVYRSKKTQKR